MKKLISIVCAVLMLMSITACSKNENTSKVPAGENIDNISDKTVSTEREPMPTYDKLGADNSIATTDGRYIYYTLMLYDVSSGANRSVCNWNTSTEFVDIVGNYIFYEQEDKLMRMNKDGTNIVQLGK